MKNHAVYCVLYGLFIVISVRHADGAPFCSWNTKFHVCLATTQFRCLDGQQCISRSMYCNGETDCDDGSDERYCTTSSCPETFTKCSGVNKCIANEWRCNGYTDCPNGDDEYNCISCPENFWKCSAVNKCIPIERVCNRNYDCPNFDDENHCSYNAEQKSKTSTNHIISSTVKQWILTQRKYLNSTEKWGSSVDKLALIYYLISNNFSPLQDNESVEMSYELNIRLLSQLSRMKIDEVPSTDLASFVNAFLVMCINPRNFHGYDIIQELKNRADQKNYTNPYVFLALCNAGETITEPYKNKLINTFYGKHRTFWTDMQAVVVMALACASKQPGNEVHSETLNQMTLELKQRQYRNGTVESLQTTALVMQALISTDSVIDPDNFDEKKAYQKLMRNRKSDWSFGDTMSTLLVTPVLTCKSLVNINSSHCLYERRDEVSAMENLIRRSGPKIRVQYSIWIGNEKDLERNLVLRVPQNMSLYGVMETAAEIDSRYKFEYTVKDRKPYINAVSALRDNPLTGKFWFLYIVENGHPRLSKESSADILPQDNDHYAMWYRRGTWVD